MAEWFQLLWSNKKALVGFGIVVFFVLLALFGPMLVADPRAFVGAPHLPPSSDFWFGTTGQGQDVLAQAIAGARVTLAVGFAVGIFVTLIGALIGISAGYFGGRIDDTLSMFTNVFLVIPGLPLAIILAAYLPPGPVSLTLVLVVSGWAWNARVFRAQALSIRKKDFIAAAKVGGETKLRIVAAEILPNMISLLVSAFIGATVYAIGAQVGLEFLGLGDVGSVTWGTNLYWAANDAALLTGSWWIFVPTGLGVAFVGFGLTLVNFAIDEVNNPRLRLERATQLIEAAEGRIGPETDELEALSAKDALGAKKDTPEGPVVVVNDLRVEFPKIGGSVKAVDGVSIEINKGDWYALCGESGSGKSTIGYAILRLLPPNARITSGEVVFQGQNVLWLKDEQLRHFRWERASMVFQSAMNALNPVSTVGAQIIDTIQAHESVESGQARRRRATALLEMVGIDPIHLDSYPHQLSGGMRQRVVIAIAMALQPTLLIMDEPTTALDVVVQKEILQRISDLKAELGFSVLFISHDMPLLMDIATHIGVLKDGRLVEEGRVDDLRTGAQHPYTKTLLSPFPALEEMEAPARAANGESALLEVRDLNISFPIGGTLSRKRNHVLHDINFDLNAGQVVAVVGESGSGKSTIARIIARVQQPDSGSFKLDGRDMLREERFGASLDYRGQVQMIFQDPFGSLNPVHKVGYHVERPLVRHKQSSGKAAPKRVWELLEEVDLTPGSDYATRYPHALSGGQRQRVAIARALAVKPKLILADEPTSMLDVSTRLGVLNQLRALCDKRGIAILFITHDLESARYLSDRILVLYSGHIVEEGAADTVLDNPAHPYTQLLLASLPHGDGEFIEPPRAEADDVALADTRPADVGCPFQNRCPEVRSVCRTVPPRPHTIADGHRAHCHLYDASIENAEERTSP